MPVIVPNSLPAIDFLKQENIFVMENIEALHQDIRPLKIVILNIMPLKIATENQILRLLTNTPLQITVDFIHFKNHISRNTPQSHLEYFYKSPDDIKHSKYDGMIITGAPVEQLDFEDVDYWNEMKGILEWAAINVSSTLFICWAAQAALFYYYGVGKYPLDNKVFGNFCHRINNKTSPIVRGFDEYFIAPHSRHTEVKREDILKVKELDLVAESADAGVYIVTSKDANRVMITGHSEYDLTTLKDEYVRDLNQGLKINIPKNYFPNDNPDRKPLLNWRSHATLLYQNWLNYYVYQITPFNLFEPDFTI